MKTKQYTKEQRSELINDIIRVGEKVAGPAPKDVRELLDAASDADLQNFDDAANTAATELLGKHAPDWN